MRFKKGQTATEYLIILAVVIVIALIVVGVLGGIPSIGGGAKSNTLSSYWRTADVGVVSFAVATANSSGTGAEGTLTLRNNFPDTITISNVSLAVSGDASKSDANSTSTVISAGSTSTFNFYDLANSGTAGESFSYDVSITYTDSATGASYTFTGDGNTLDGTIASSITLS